MPEIPKFPVAIAAPYETCNCCGNIFFYIDSFYMGYDKDGNATSGGESHIPNLCIPCGGGYTKTGWVSSL